MIKTNSQILQTLELLQRRPQKVLQELKLRMQNDVAPLNSNELTSLIKESYTFSMLESMKAKYR